MPFDPSPTAETLSPAAQSLALSVVVPVFNEAGNIAPLIDEIAAATRGLGACEIVCVDDGSTDGSAAEIAARRTIGPRLRLIRHVRNLGQSAALRTGILAARAPLVATLDGDGQNDPADIPDLVAALRDADDPDGVGMVGGVRTWRRDNWVRRLSSRIANGVRAALLRDGAVDTGCGLRLVRREAFLTLPYFDHLHRFLPAMVRTTGWGVLFVPVGHRPRRYGRSKYGVLDRLGAGLVDLFGVMWLQRRYRYFRHCARESYGPDPWADGEQQ